MLIAGTSFMLHAGGPDNPRLYANPASETIGLTVPRQNYTFDVMLENATRVTTIAFSLYFDPLKVNVTRITIGDALPGGLLLIADWNATAGFIQDIMTNVMGVFYDVDNKTVVTITVSILDFTGEAGTLLDIREMSCWDFDLNQFLSGDSPYDHTLYAVATQTSLYSSPAIMTLGQVYPPIGRTYTFNVVLENASNVVTIAFSLQFDPSKVNVTNIVKGNALPGGDLLIGNWDPVAGIIQDITLFVLGQSYDVDQKTVVTVTVEARDFTGEAGTIIDIYGMSCWDEFSNEFLSGDCPWGHMVRIFNPGVRDVAAIDIIVMQSAIYAGDLATIKVDIQNQGDFEETINTTLYADINTTIIGDEVVISQKTSILRTFRRTTLEFQWDALGCAAGNYSLTVSVSELFGEVDLQDNNLTKGVIMVFEVMPCPDVTVTCPTSITVNPSIFTYSSVYMARLIDIGNVIVKSTGFDGGLRVVGSRNGTIRLCVNQPDVDYYVFYLPQYGEVQIPIWLMFQPETHWDEYRGNFTLQLTVCGTHRRQLLISSIDIIVCQNGAYVVNSETATFTWTLTGGSLVYLIVEPNMPPGWTYTVDPEPGTFFETPHVVTVNITAPPDAIEGDMGILTLKAYKNETGALIWEFIYFASTDNNPPTIESIETPIMSPDGTLLFNTTARDRSGIQNVALHYSVDGKPWENRTMDWASGDTFNSTQYAWKEPFETVPETLQYYVTVTDWFGNQTQSEPQIIPIVSDIGISQAKACKTVISQGSEYTLNLTISNEGTLPLDFINFALYANSTILEMHSLYDVLNGTSIPLSLIFNTSILQKGSYVISAYLLCLPNETDTADNTRIFVLTVTIQGDFSGDFKVGPYDFALLSAAYGSTPENPKWNPNCDANNDGKVGPADFAILAAYFGRHYP
jgi:hypothetical protein